MTGALMLAAIVAFGLALARVNPFLAVGINVVAVGGALPTLWRWRRARTIRWVIYGVSAGVLLGWIALLLSAL
ncbi:DUF2537 domain-containing protein [Antrihabitans cavernicola]|uniref:DUF2537 domain-containing protein n=2 Tax=Antrihabitans cavernicola TaxID=2495913 RepID=A0A5A7S525_9NOCA|nr:DUF2537 domain-containing protein [Spelaeibacter cavernicola]